MGKVILIVEDAPANVAVARVRLAALLSLDKQKSDTATSLLSTTKQNDVRVLRTLFPDPAEVLDNLVVKTNAEEALSYLDAHYAEVAVVVMDHDLGRGEPTGDVILAKAQERLREHGVACVDYPYVIPNSSTDNEALCEAWPAEKLLALTFKMPVSPARSNTSSPAAIASSVRSSTSSPNISLHPLLDSSAATTPPASEFSFVCLEERGVLTPLPKMCPRSRRNSGAASANTSTPRFFGVEEATEEEGARSLSSTPRPSSRKLFR